MTIKLQSDNTDYHVIQEGIELVKNIPGLTCEVGVRAGGGSQYIMEALAKSNQHHKTHIGIDPYGNILLKVNRSAGRYDYTNDMRNKCMVGLYQLSSQLNINFLFFALEDTEFFKRFGDGIPVYQNMGGPACGKHSTQHCLSCGEKKVESQYSFVFLDGPHETQSVIEEFKFFNDRMPKDSVIVFDDHLAYDMNKIEKEHLANNWELITETKAKKSFRKR